jgi:hypothetical protein
VVSLNRISELPNNTKVEYRNSGLNGGTFSLNFLKEEEEEEWICACDRKDVNLNTFFSRKVLSLKIVMYATSFTNMLRIAAALLNRATL